MIRFVCPLASMAACLSGISSIIDIDPILSLFDRFLSLQTRVHTLQEKQNKSVEEREEEYQRARDRIFKQEVRRRKTDTHSA